MLRQNKYVDLSCQEHAYPEISQISIQSHIDSDPSRNHKNHIDEHPSTGVDSLAPSDKASYNSTSNKKKTYNSLGELKADKVGMVANQVPAKNTQGKETGVTSKQKARNKKGVSPKQNNTPHNNNTPQSNREAASQEYSRLREKVEELERTTSKIESQYIETVSRLEAEVFSKQDRNNYMRSEIQAVRRDLAESKRDMTVLISMIKQMTNISTAQQVVYSSNGGIATSNGYIAVSQNNLQGMNRQGAEEAYLINMKNLERRSPCNSDKETLRTSTGGTKKTSNEKNKKSSVVATAAGNVNSSQMALKKSNSIKEKSPTTKINGTITQRY